MLESMQNQCCSATHMMIQGKDYFCILDKLSAVDSLCVCVKSEQNYLRNFHSVNCYFICNPTQMLCVRTATHCFSEN